jgi:DNA-binding transcriptional LysR family regulator
MNWDHLRSFLAAARSGTLSGASRSLQVKHSTIGRHLSSLEETGRTKLFHRSPAGLSLTSAGERLLKAAETIESEIQKAQSDIGGEDLAVSGKVRIAVPEGMGAILLAPALAMLTAHHPALSIQLIAMPRLFNLTNREADITVTLTLPQRGRLVSRRITDYALGLFASESYLRDRGTPTDKDDLKSHRFINYIDDLLFTSELNYLDEVVDNPATLFNSSSIVAQMFAVKAGAGIAVLPYFMASLYPDIRPVLPEIKIIRSWWLNIHEEQKDLARIRLVADYVHKELNSKQQHLHTLGSSS